MQESSEEHSAVSSRCRQPSYQTVQTSLRRRTPQCIHSDRVIRNFRRPEDNYGFKLHLCRIILFDILAELTD